MQLTVQTKALSKALTQLKRSYVKSPTVPALRCTYIEAFPDEVYLTCSDGVNWLRVRLSCSAYQYGTALIPLQEVYEFVRATKSPEISIGHHTEVDLTLIAGSTSCKIEGFKPDTFPPIPIIPAEHSGGYCIGEHLGNIFSKVYDCVSTDDEFGTSIQNLLLTANENGELQSVGLDGNLLGVSSCRLECGVPDHANRYCKGSWLFSPPTVEIIQKQFEDRTSLRCSDSLWEIEDENSRLVCKVQPGTYFPRWERVIPINYQSGFIVNTKLLQSSVKALKGIPQVGMSVDNEGEVGVCCLSGNSDNGKIIADSLKVVFKGFPFLIKLKTSSLLKAVTQIKSSETVIKHTNNLVKIYPKGEESLQMYIVKGLD